jgi:tetraacyldisaccharide 4'-kinase
MTHRPESLPRSLSRPARRLRGQVAGIIGGADESTAAGLRRLLAAAAWAYGGLQRLRPRLYGSRVLASRRLPCPVISVGNLTLGGTGKTPMAIAIAGRLQGCGLKVSVVSRGYKGGREHRGGIVSDGHRIRLSPEEAGDEPYLMACRLKGVPVVVGRDRFRAGMKAWREFGVDCIVLDDAFQHLALCRDLDLVLLDFMRPFGNGRLFPAGPLREPLAALTRAGAVVLTRTPAGVESRSSSPADAVLRNQERCPVFCATHEPYGYLVPRETTRKPAHAGDALFTPAMSDWRRRPALAFSGIARNDDFRDTLRRLGCEPAAALAFPDHHAYSPRDAAAILAAAGAAGAELLITSEKDHARMAGRIAWPLDLAVVGVGISFGRDEAAFDAFLQRRLESLMGGRAAG